MAARETQVSTTKRKNAILAKTPEIPLARHNLPLTKKKKKENPIELAHRVRIIDEGFSRRRLLPSKTYPVEVTKASRLRLTAVVLTTIC